MRFSHDLIREAVLEIFSLPGHDTMRRKVGQKLSSISHGRDPIAQFEAAYVCANSLEIITVGKQIANELELSYRPFLASEIYWVMFAILDEDPDVLHYPQAHLQSPILRRLTLPNLSVAAPLQASLELYEVLEGLMRCDRFLSGASSESMARIISQYLLLVRKLGNSVLRSKGLSFHGHSLIGQRRYVEAEKVFVQAIDEAENSQSPDEYSSLFDAQKNAELGKAIAQRLQRNEKGSRETLRALAHGHKNKDELLIRFEANLGATFMYTDADLRNKHWQTALDIAVEIEHKALELHMRNDLVGTLIWANQLTEAEEEVLSTISMAEQQRDADQLMRALLNGAAVYCLSDQPDKAIDLLRDSKAIGFQIRAVRRMWKVYASLANANEMLGNAEQAAQDDKFMLQCLPNQIEFRDRTTLGAANAILRYKERSNHVSAVWDEFGHHFEIGEILLTTANKGSADAWPFPDEHLKTHGKKKRFVIV